MSENSNTKMTFAGVTFKTTKTSRIRRPAFLKILRSGRVRVTCNGHYTDDYAYDAAVNFRRGALSPEAVAKMADRIERYPSGWVCSAYREKGQLSLRCHSFKSYTIEELPAGLTVGTEVSVAIEGCRARTATVVDVGPEWTTVEMPGVRLEVAYDPEQGCWYDRGESGWEITITETMKKSA